MGRSRNAPSPLIKRSRPDKEEDSKACDKAVSQWDLENESTVEFYSPEEELESAEPKFIWIDPELGQASR